MADERPSTAADAISVDRFLAAITSASPSLRSRTLLPDAPGWDAARSVFQQVVDQRPAVVVQAESVDDVRATVRAASSAGLRVAPQSTGHNAAPLGDLSGTVLLRTQGMQGLSIDPTNHTARVEAGVRWGDVVKAAAPHGLSALAGTSPTVGVVGYLLGGGLAWLGRAHGLAANYVSAVELVTADGELRRVDPDNEPDLFWAVRGGGGGFGVVTAVEFRLIGTRPMLGGALSWDLERAAEVLQTWGEVLATVPDEIATLAQLIRVPDLPEAPAPLRGRAIVSVQIVSLLPREITVGHLAPLLQLDPETVRLDEMSPVELLDLHMDPPEPLAFAADGLGLQVLSAEVIDAIIAAVGPVADTQLSLLEIRDLRGTLAAADPAGGATASVTGDALVFALGAAPTPAVERAVRTELASLHRTLDTWSTLTTLPGFVESRRGVEALYPPETLERLTTLKDTYDPHDLVQANHPLRRTHLDGEVSGP